MSAELTRENRLALADYFLSRSRGERTTALAFSHIASDLRQLAGAGDLVGLAHSAQQDEQRHALICQRLAQSYAGQPVPDALPRATLPATLPGASDADQRVLRTVFGCCFGETIAVQWLIDCQALCRDPVLRRYNRDHIADEVKHSRIGWHLLTGDLLRARDKSLIAHYVPLMVRWSRRLWDAESGPCDEALEGFGCPSPERTRASVEKALNEVILPGLEHHGVAVRDGV